MTVRDTLRERVAIVAESYPGVAIATVRSWSYASVARQYTDRARALPGQWPSEPRVRAATQAVRRCLSPYRDEMVGPQDVAVEALESLDRVLTVVQAEIDGVMP